MPLVEDGRVRRGDAVTERVVEEYLAPVKAAGVDTLVLSCYTRYIRCSWTSFRTIGRGRDAH